MGDAYPLTTSSPVGPAPVMPTPAAVRPLESARCALCGAPLGPRSLRHHVLSPRDGGVRLTVCHTCHKAALGEGYRPA